MKGMMITMGLYTIITAMVALIGIPFDLLASVCFLIGCAFIGGAFDVEV